MNFLELLLMPVFGWFSRLLIAMRLKQLGMKKKCVHTQDGTWYYIQGGEGPPLVLIHGFAANKENWLAIAPELMKTNTLYLPDLLGFGESSKPIDFSYTIIEQAKLLVNWADAIGLNQFHVGGNSMGGYLAGVLAGMYKSRISSAWLLNPAGVEGAQMTEIGRAFVENREIVLVPKQYKQHLQIIDLCFNNVPPPIPGVMRKYFGWVNVHHKTLLEKIFLEFVDPDSNPSLNTVLLQADCEILVVWGEKDQLVHVSGLHILKELLPNIDTQLLDNTGHCPMLDRVEPILQKYKEFRHRHKFKNQPPAHTLNDSLPNPVS